MKRHFLGLLTRCLILVSFFLIFISSGNAQDFFIKAGGGFSFPGSSYPTNYYHGPLGSGVYRIPIYQEFDPGISGFLGAGIKLLNNSYFYASYESTQLNIQIQNRIELNSEELQSFMGNFQFDFISQNNVKLYVLAGGGMDILEAYFLNADGGTEKTPSVGIQFGVGASTHVFKNVSIFIEPRSHITFFNPYTSVLKPHASALFPIQAGLYFDL